MHSRRFTHSMKRQGILAALLVAVLGAAWAMPQTPGLHILWEDAFGMGGGLVQAPSLAFISTHNGATVSGHGATISGFTVFMGPNLEPTSGAFVAEGTDAWLSYE